MTRLCDLSVEGDSVTSVGWSERVSAEGSALGLATCVPPEGGRQSSDVCTEIWLLPFPSAAQVHAAEPRPSFGDCAAASAAAWLLGWKCAPAGVVVAEW